MRHLLLLTLGISACTFGHDPGSGAGTGYGSDPYGYGVPTYRMDLVVDEYRRFDGRLLGAQSWFDGAQGYFEYFMPTNEVFMSLTLDGSVPALSEEMSARLALTATDAEQNEDDPDAVGVPMGDSVTGTFYFCPNDGSGSVTVPVEVWREPDEDGKERLGFRSDTGGARFRARLLQL